MKFLLFVFLIPNIAFAKFPDGTVLFVENTNLVVETITDFETTHVCVILDDMVYNAEPPVVKKYSVPEYLNFLAGVNGTSRKSKTLVCLPKKPLRQKQIVALRKYLEGEVGRRYSLRGYIQGVESDGIHCAQLTTEALVSIGQIKSEKPWMVTPGMLRSVVQPMSNSKGFYFMTNVPKKMVFRRFGDWLYDRSVFCSWSCWETLTFCDLME